MKMFFRCILLFTIARNESFDTHALTFFLSFVCVLVVVVNVFLRILCRLNTHTSIHKLSNETFLQMLDI